MDNFKLPKKKLGKMGIAGIYLFGSQAQGVSGPLSDFDFGILLENSKILKNSKKRNRLYDQLYEMFSQQVKQLTDIDIIFLQDVYLQLQYHVVTQGKLIYQENPKMLADFKERIIEAYADFAFLREEQHRAILAKI